MELKLLKDFNLSSKFLINCFSISDNEKQEIIFKKSLSEFNFISYILSASSTGKFKDVMLNNIFFFIYASKIKLICNHVQSSFNDKHKIVEK